MAGLLVLAAAAGPACDAEWITSPRDPVSIVRISTLDAEDDWVLGTGLRIVTPGGASDAAITTEQPYGTSGPPGRWTITVEPPEGWAVDPSQDHPLRLDVPPDTTLAVVIRLVEMAPAVRRYQPSAPAGCRLR